MYALPEQSSVKFRHPVVHFVNEGFICVELLASKVEFEVTENMLVRRIEIRTTVVMSLEDSPRP